MFSLLEFSLLMSDIREAEQETDKQRRDLVIKAEALLRRSGTERGLREEKSDEAEACLHFFHTNLLVQALNLLLANVRCKGTSTCKSTY